MGEDLSRLDAALENDGGMGENFGPILDLQDAIYLLLGVQTEARTTFKKKRILI